MTGNDPKFALTTSEYFPSPLVGKVHANAQAAAISIENGWAREWDAMPTSLREAILDEIRSGAVDGRMLRWLLESVLRLCIFARREGPDEELPFAAWFPADIVSAMAYAAQYENVYDESVVVDLRVLAAATARLDEPGSFEFFEPVFDPKVDMLAWVRGREEFQPASL